ncbi:MAG: DNA-3-methyladenine glycosylase I [Saprospiraceae bacterium]
MPSSEFSDKSRCAWANSNPLFIPYHDNEWGVPVHDDRLLFEMLNLEGAQAGVSWLVVLKKRENYCRHFENFDAEKIARFSDDRLEEILTDPGVIRNRLKIYGVRTNAVALLKVQEEFGSFDKYIWQFVGGKPKVNDWKDMSEVPSRTAESDAMSKDLKKRGFKFIGTTICYAYMQAVGMVNDHTRNCFCRNK